MKSETVLNVPLFVEKCILHILKEGVSVEGIYRVPGNKVYSVAYISIV